MKITPTPPPTTASAELKPALPVGRVLDALVSGNRGNNLIELTAGRMRLLAESSMNLQTGTRVQLRVEGQDAQLRPLLRVLTPTQSDASAQLRAILPKQEAASTLLAQLSQLAAAKPAEPTLQQLLSSLDRLPARQQVVTPEALKAALRSSGLFLEAQLARGEAPQQDIKQELLRLAAQLRQLKANPPPTPAAGATTNAPARGAAGAAPNTAATVPAGAVPTTAGTAAAPIQAAAGSSPVSAQPGNPTANSAAANPTANSAPAAGKTPAPPAQSAATPPVKPPAAAANQSTPATRNSGAQGAAASAPAAGTSTGNKPAAPANSAAPNPQGAAPTAREADLAAREALNLRGADRALSATTPPTEGQRPAADSSRLMSEYLQHNSKYQARAQDVMPGGTQPLARAAAQPVESSNIMRLIDLLFGQVESTLARLESTQLMQVQSRDGQLPQWLFEIPVRDRDGIDILKFTVEREAAGKGKDNGEQGWHITLSFDFPNTGPVIARISQYAEAIDVKLYAESANTLGFIERYSDDLKSTLLRRGVNDLKLDIQQGLPEQAADNERWQSMIEDSA